MNERIKASTFLRDNQIGIESDSRDVSLAFLVAVVADENRHGEVEWGTAQGNEEW